MGDLFTWFYSVFISSIRSFASIIWFKLNTNFQHFSNRSKISGISLFCTWSNGLSADNCGLHLTMRLLMLPLCSSSFNKKNSQNLSDPLPYATNSYQQATSLLNIRTWFWTSLRSLLVWVKIRPSVGFSEPRRCLHFSVFAFMRPETNLEDSYKLGSVKMDWWNMKRTGNSVQGNHLPGNILKIIIHWQTQVCVALNMMSGIFRAAYPITAWLYRSCWW